MRRITTPCSNYYDNQSNKRRAVKIALITIFSYSIVTTLIITLIIKILSLEELFLNLVLSFHLLVAKIVNFTCFDCLFDSTEEFVATKLGMELMEEVQNSVIFWYYFVSILITIVLYYFKLLPQFLNSSPKFVKSQYTLL